MDIGNTLRTLRKEKKITQMKFSEMSGITQTYLSQIETNQKRVSDRLLKSICKALKISVGGFYIMALREEDVPKHKREIFKAIEGAIKNIFFEK